MTLEAYYATDWWKKLSKKLIKENNICEICGREHYHISTRAGKKNPAGHKRLMRRFCVHHKTYKHIFKEPREDLLVICYSCHEFGHHFDALIERNPEYKLIYQEYKLLSGWDAEKRDRKQEIL